MTFEEIQTKLTVNKVIDKSRQGEALTFSYSSGIQRDKLLFIESYGCQMNFSDSEIVASILADKGYSTTTDYKEADLILINTCAIREGAEQRVRGRLREFNGLKRRNPKLMVGVLGCMAERLKSKFLEEEKIVDLVVGPDAYRDLPNLIEKVEDGRKAVNVLLSLEETYADINPVRLCSNGVTAFISIMRGCDNMCSFCVVPFTRGRERSRSPQSIIEEAKTLFENGYREITLLGQNVDSYLWHPEYLSKKEINKAEQALSSCAGRRIKEEAVTFAQLLEKVANISSDLRIRFSTSNPQDMTDDVLHVIAKYENVCKYIHLPVQSGSTSVLRRMNRGYTREQYLQRIEAIRKIIPECGISTDIITGFCGETEEEHAETISLMNKVRFDYAYMFAYSERPGTLAQKKYKDDVPEQTKKERLQEIIKLQMQHSSENIKNGLGKVHRVLIEGFSKKSAEKLYGRNSQNVVVVFPKGNYNKGEYVNVLVKEVTPATMLGEVVN